MNNRYTDTKEAMPDSKEREEKTNLRCGERTSFLPGAVSKGSGMTWRRVEEALPELNQLVLVCFKSGCNGKLIRAVAYRTFHHGRYCWSTDLIYDEPQWYTVDEIDVTHWMPLPKVPLT